MTEKWRNGSGCVPFWADALGDDWWRQTTVSVGDYLSGNRGPGRFGLYHLPYGHRGDLSCQLGFGGYCWCGVFFAAVLIARASTPYHGRSEREGIRVGVVSEVSRRL